MVVRWADCGQPCRCFLFCLFFSIFWLLEGIENEYGVTWGPGFSEGKTQAWIQWLWKFLFRSWKVQVGLTNSFEDFIFIPEIMSWFYLTKASRWQVVVILTLAQRLAFKKYLSRDTLEERIDEVYIWYICHLAPKNWQWVSMNVRSGDKKALNLTQVRKTTMNTQWLIIGWTAQPSLHERFQKGHLCQCYDCIYCQQSLPVVTVPLINA